MVIQSALHGDMQKSAEMTGFMANLVMDNRMQFCDAKDAGGKAKGNTFTWDVVQDVATAGGTLVETSTMPETNFTVIQGTLSITEYGNSVPYSGKLEALSKFETRKPIMQALKNDAKKTFDRAAYAQFYLTPLRVAPTAGTASDTVALMTTGTCTVTNTIAYGNLHAKAIVDTMKERNIPPYVGDDYMAIAWPTTLRGFKNSLETLHQYTESGIKLIFNGEIGRYENVRYTEQTNVSKGISTTGASGTAWSQSKSDWIFFFGEDTVAEGIAIPEEMRAKIPTDYGRSKGVAYYYLGGFGLVHTNAVQARVVMWDSAV